MFDRVNDISERLSGESGSGDADPGEIRDLLDDGEELAHVLANSGTIEHTEDGRTTTIEAGGSASAFMLVTDERVLFVLGDQPGATEIEFSLRSIRSSHVRKGILNTKLEVNTPDESVLFDPDEGDVEAAEEFIDRVGSAWANASAALSKARGTIEEFEAACRSGGDANERALSAQSQFSQARREATRYDEVPEQKIRAEINEVATELDRTRVSARLDRVETELDAMDEAMADDRFGDAAEAYAAAAETVEAAREAMDEVDDPPADAPERFDDLEPRVEAAGERFLDEGVADCETALSAAEATEAVEAWDQARERYDAAVAAGWNGHAPVGEEAIEFQLAWVSAGLLDAISERADALESEGDDREGDDATEYYEDAEEWYERARDVAAERPHHSAERYDHALERLEGKRLESAGWEFGAS